MTTDFGDADPEDAYDEGDPLLVRYAVLRLWVASIALEQARAHDHTRIVARIQAARWATGLLLGDTRAKGIRPALTVLASWLDELLQAEGG